MEIREVKLKDLKPNLFRTLFMDEPFNEERITRLQESISKRGFCDGFVGRESRGVIEIAYGHYRLEAAIRTLGEDHETWVDLYDFTDHQMFRMLIDKASSIGEGSPLVLRVDTAILLHKLILEHPDFCELDRPHQHGFEECLSACLSRFPSWLVDKAAQEDTNVFLNCLAQYKENDAKFRNELADRLRSGGTQAAEDEKAK